MVATLAPWLWNNSIRDNVIVTIVVGGPLSIYLAFLVNRLAAFRAIRLSAINELALFHKVCLESGDALRGSIVVNALLEIPVICFAAEEQWDAAHTLKDIRTNLRTHFRNEFDSAGMDRSFHQRADFRGNEWVDAQQEIFKKSKEMLRNAFVKIQRIRPSPWRILGLVPANATLNQWEAHVTTRWLAKIYSLFSKAPTRFKAFQAYCRGETDDF